MCHEIPHQTRLYRDHGSLTISTKTDDKDAGWFNRQLLADAVDPEGRVTLMSDLSRCLQHADPSTMEELARGYRLALDAGLISEASSRSEIRRAEKMDAILNDAGFVQGLCARQGRYPIDLVSDVVELVVNHPLIKADTHE